MKKPKAIIFDRDGTLIRHVPYLADPADVVLLDGAREALQAAISHNIRLFLHTNQSGIGRGFFDMCHAHSCNERLNELLDLGPHPFERICIAPEAPDMPSIYRKPSPAFAQEIMRDYGLDAQEICYIGDRGSDLATAHAAGTRAVGVTTGLDDLQAELAALGLAGKYPVFGSILDAFDHILTKA